MTTTIDDKLEGTILEQLQVNNRQADQRCPYLGRDFTAIKEDADTKHPQCWGQGELRFSTISYGCMATGTDGCRLTSQDTHEQCPIYQIAERIQ